MKNTIITLALSLIGCNPNFNTGKIADYTLKNGAPYEIRMDKVYSLSYKFENETEAIARRDSLYILFKRKIDTSQFAREGRILDNNLDNKLELCDPKDECKDQLAKIMEKIQ
ncbi:hypothetical protein HYU23_04145 [Candidatus Woesearchaeota archaeon]|nr:hypothetical protein [Candidatus Woesearchaeota archaeon]